MTYEAANAIFAEWGVDTEYAINRLRSIPISINCWQGDDVVGFDAKAGMSGGGITATGNHPGRARNPSELRADLEFALSMIPGRHRLNLHAMYMDTDDAPDRDEIEFRHFATWVDWARENELGIDFNPTFFAHTKADDDLTLSHPDIGIREFWIEHGRRTREIAAQMGREIGSPVINNVWVPDGYKDTPIDRSAARKRLEASLDAMLSDNHDRENMLDAVESKLFGIGVEACTVGSYDFYLGYAIRKSILLCLDMGHFHPTEDIADKLSAVALSLNGILLHVSRPMRWDSDHVILLNDDIMAMARELVSAELLDRTHIGLDFFDATISRTAAWVLGTRNMQKALLRAMLLPLARLKAAEAVLDFTQRLVVMEEAKDLPYGEVWSEFCKRENVPTGQVLIGDLAAYQNSVSDR